MWTSTFANNAEQLWTPKENDTLHVVSGWKPKIGAIPQV